MKGKIFVIGFALLCLTGLGLCQDADELINQADKIFEEMSDLTAANEALALYRKASGTEGKEYECYWKISRIMYYIGAHQEKKKEREATFAQAVYWAGRAVELNPDLPHAYYWRGVNNGKYGETKGVLKSLRLVKPIKNDMNKVIEIDRSYEDGGPDRVLGRVYFKLPGFAGGSKDKSLEHLEKSKEYGPEDAITRVYLAETLMKHKEIDRAKAELDYVMNMPDDPRWVLDIRESKAMAEELLKDKKFRNK